MKNEDVQINQIVKCNNNLYRVIAMKYDPEDPNEPFFELEPIKQSTIWRHAEDLEQI